MVSKIRALLRQNQPDADETARLKPRQALDALLAAKRDEYFHALVRGQWAEAGCQSPTEAHRELFAIIESAYPGPFAAQIVALTALPHPESIEALARRAIVPWSASHSARRSRATGSSTG